MKDLKLINPENVSEEEAEGYRKREACRAVAVDADGNVALLYVSKANYYKLPGGGLEDGEDRMIALQRECQEEIGCEIEVVGEIGSIIEYRKIRNLKQASYCYLVKVKGKKGVPSFTESEADRGFKEIWLPYEEALQIMRNTKAPHSDGNDYIIPRDLVFLEEAKGLLN